MKDGVTLERNGTGNTVVIEFGSPNIAKPISMGNLRTTIIGNALARMYQAQGWTVIRINHLGDWGSQFGKVLAAYQRWGNEERLFKDPVNELLSLYVRFHAEVGNEPTLEDGSRAWFQEIDGRKMSSRKGDVVLLDDVLDESVRRVLAVLAEKNLLLEDTASVVETIGVGAVIFHDLKNQRMREEDFSWEDVLNFDGETGPYVQYTFARIGSLINKAQFTPTQFLEAATQWEVSPGVTDLEWQLWSELSRYPETVSQATEKNGPFMVARRLLAIAHGFNSLYNQQRILIDDMNERNKMLGTAYHTGQVIKHGLDLLGIEAADRM